MSEFEWKMGSHFAVVGNGQGKRKIGGSHWRQSNHCKSVCLNRPGGNERSGHLIVAATIVACCSSASTHGFLTAVSGRSFHSLQFDGDGRYLLLVSSSEAISFGG